jgi:cell division protein FtsB
MNRTIQNYQKAYRKKVEGLKTELATVRADNGQLKQQVKKLRRQQWTHLPSMIVGAALAAAAAVLRRKWLQNQQDKDSTAAAAAEGDT